MPAGGSVRDENTSLQGDGARNRLTSRCRLSQRGDSSVRSLLSETIKPYHLAAALGFVGRSICRFFGLAVGCGRLRIGGRRDPPHPPGGSFPPVRWSLLLPAA